MMHTKGQGAMEYLMTYGWAILVVIIVGVVLWQMGIFSGGSTSATFVGFGPLKPVEWSCSAQGDSLTLTIMNGAGGQITNVTMTAVATDGNTSQGVATCTKTIVAAGDTTVCKVATLTGTSSCLGATAGSSYSQGVSIGYTSPTGQPRTSSGTVKGPADQ